MANLRLTKEDLEMLFDNSDLTTDVTNRIFEEAREDFWADILTKRMEKEETLVEDAIKEAVREYLNRELKDIVRDVITEDFGDIVEEKIVDAVKDWFKKP